MGLTTKDNHELVQNIAEFKVEVGEKLITSTILQGRDRLRGLIVSAIEQFSKLKM